MYHRYKWTFLRENLFLGFWKKIRLKAVYPASEREYGQEKQQPPTADEPLAPSK